jgi:hypothetical protein
MYTSAVLRFCYWRRTKECQIHVFKLFLRAAEKKIGYSTIEEILAQEKMKIAKSRLNELKNNAPRMYEVLKIIAELNKTNQNITTGLVKEEIKRKGLASE